MSIRHPSGQPKHTTRYNARLRTESDHGDDEGKYSDMTHNIVTVLGILFLIVGIALAIKFNPGS